MNKTLEILGSIVGAVGILICLVAGLNRLTVGYYIMGHETVTYFIVGMALMVMGCLAFLQSVALRLR